MIPVSRGSGRDTVVTFVACGLLAGAALMGCSTDDGSTAPADAAATATTVALELVASIGCSDCGTEAQITPTVIVLDGNGRLAVLDRYEPFVRVFSVAGAHEVSFGTRGQGPGELGSSIGNMFYSGVYLLPWPGGNISVLELMPAVLETFSAEGEFVRQETLELPFAAPGSQAFAASTRTYFRHAYLPMSEQADVIEKCTIVLQGESHCEQIVTATTLTGVEPEGFRASLSIAATPSGELVIADRSTYRLWVVGESGTVLRGFGRDIPPPPKSEEQLETERAANRRRLEQGREERAIDPNLHYLAAGGLHVDGAGRIWALTQRYTPEQWVFDVFAPDGTYLNEVAITSATVADGYQVTPFTAAGEHLAAISNKPDGSARIDVYRIVE